VKEGRERRRSVVFVEANDPKERKVRTITSMEGQGSVLPLRRANEIVRPALSLQKGRSATVRVLRFDVLPTLSDADTAVHAARDETEPMQKTRWRRKGRIHRKVTARRLDAAPTEKSRSSHKPKWEGRDKTGRIERNSVDEKQRDDATTERSDPSVLSALTLLSPYATILHRTPLDV
jgi:hypothetical protein